MNEKRYFKVEYDEEWYLFDSTTISEQLVKEQAEYGYGVFANSLSPSEVVKLLNEQQSEIDDLKEEIGEWKKENRRLLDQIQEFEKIPKSIRELWVE